MKKFIVLLAMTSALLFVNVHFTSASTLNWQSVVGLSPATISSGFGDVANRATQSMAVFGGYLYAGTRNENAGTEIWRTADGVTWANVVGPDGTIGSGFGDVNTVSTISLAVFGNYLYAGTRNANNTGTEIWRSSDGITWTNVVGPGGTISSGFGATETFSTNCLSAFGSYLYAGTANNTTGTQVWRTSNGTNWTQANTSGFGDPNNEGTFSMAIFGSYLYAGVGYSNSAQVWRTSNGTDWTMANTPGFGDPVSGVNVRALAVFGNYLYAGTGFGSRTQIWRSPDGTTWTNVVGPGGTIGNSFAEPQNWAIHSLTVLGAYLYASTDGMAQIWRSSDGIIWTQTNVAGFGDPSCHDLQSQAVFGNYLYAGTNGQNNGTSVWRLEAEPSPQPSPEPQPAQLPYTGGGSAPSDPLGRLGTLLPIVLAGFAALALGRNVLQRRQANV